MTKINTSVKGNGVVQHHQSSPPPLSSSLFFLVNGERLGGYTNGGKKLGYKLWKEENIPGRSRVRRIKSGRVGWQRCNSIKVDGIGINILLIWSCCLCRCRSNFRYHHCCHGGNNNESCGRISGTSVTCRIFSSW